MITVQWLESDAATDSLVPISWLTIEPFIVPGLFEPFNANNDDPDSVNLAIDEWTLCEQLGNNMSTVIEEHYKTFIVSFMGSKCVQQLRSRLSNFQD